jgi:hypothetical protein
MLPKVVAGGWNKAASKLMHTRVLLALGAPDAYGLDVPGEGPCLTNAVDLMVRFGSLPVRMVWVPISGSDDSVRISQPLQMVEPLCVTSGGLVLVLCHVDHIGQAGEPVTTDLLTREQHVDAVILGHGS